jgi:hypothetical protein
MPSRRSAVWVRVAISELKVDVHVTHMTQDEHANDGNTCASATCHA